MTDATNDARGVGSTPRHDCVLGRSLGSGGGDLVSLRGFDGMRASYVTQALIYAVRALEPTESVRVCVRDGVARLERR